MATKITVNGVTYDSVEAMPPDARRLYEETLAKVPELADRDGDGIPDIAQRPGLSATGGTTVRTRLVVNGKEYDGVAALPPNLRAAYEKAMQVMSAGGPNVKKNEIKVVVQTSMPRFEFRLGSRPPASAETPPPQLPTGMTPRPIEPGNASGAFRFVLLLGAFLAAGVLLWMFTHAQ